MIKTLRNIFIGIAALSLLFSSFSLQASALDCKGGNIFQQQLCKQLLQDELGSSPLDFLESGVNDEIVRSTQGFKEGTIQESGCYQMKGRGGHYSISATTDKSFLFLGGKNSILTDTLQRIDIKTSLYVEQDLKDRSGVKKPWPLSGCVHSNWDNFNAVAQLNNLNMVVYSLFKPNIISVKVVNNGKDYEIELNPEVKVYGGITDDVNLSFNLHGKDRNLLEQIVFDVANFISAITHMPAAFLFDDADGFMDEFEDVLFIPTDDKIYNYSGISAYEEIGKLAIQKFEDHINNNKDAANLLLETKTNEMNNQIENRLNHFARNADGNLVVYIPLSQVHGAAIAPILPAIISLII